MGALLEAWREKPGPGQRRRWRWQRQGQEPLHREVQLLQANKRVVAEGLERGLELARVRKGSLVRRDEVLQGALTGYAAEKAVPSSGGTSGEVGEEKPKRIVP